MTRNARRLWTTTLLALAAVHLAAAADRPAVKLGIDVLEARRFDALKGMRVGLVTNPTGVAGDLRSTVDILHKAPEVNLVALFGPEHGVRGDVAAGEKIDDKTDERTGLPMRSLYGKTRKPTPEMLADIDVLVFDIQDIGSRSYTYISTLAVVMEAAGEQGKKVIVLDRPNPITGVRVEGRPLDLEFKSFVGQLPIPYLHGMTVGELAQMINGEGWNKDGVRCELEVIKMEGWTRAMWWDETGLHWVPTSPHIPRWETSAYYAVTGIAGELGAMNIGVGYTLPFELVGKPGIDPVALADELNGRKLPGVFFRPTFYTPFYAKFKDETCGGVHVIFTDRDRADFTAIQFHLMAALQRLDPELKYFGTKRDQMFDKVCGTDLIRKQIDAGEPVEKVLATWQSGVDDFRKLREKYLLYR